MRVMMLITLFPVALVVLLAGLVVFGVGVAP